MTAPNGPILFNSSTGNDSAASGLGPSSAVYGSSGELDGTSTVDVSYDGVDLSSISAGDLLYCSTSTGRQFSIIASVDTLNETITTDDVWPSESGVSWAVGGKRATLQNSQYLWIKNDGAGGGLTYELETDQAMTSYVTSYSGMGGKIKSSVAGTKRTLDLGSTYFSLGGGWNCYDIHFTSSANAKLGGASTATQTSTWTLTDCIVGDATNYFDTLGVASSRTFGVYARRTTFQDFGTRPFSNITFLHARECLIKDCPSVYYSNSLGSLTVSLYRCIVRDCTSIGYMRRGQNVTLVSNIFYGIGGFSYQDYGTTNVRENIFVNMTSQIESYTTDNPNWYRNAHFNSTGTWPPPDDSDPITLTADPFTDAANEDFSLNNDAGGGAVLRAVTTSVDSTTFNPFNWLTDGSGGGGGSTFHPLAEPNHPLAQ